MAGGHVSDPVADWLAAVAARLAGPASVRVAIRDELRDGLLETLERQLARGCPRREATATALAEFGDPDTVAAAFAPQLAAVQARRVALGLLWTGPLVGLAWIAALAAGASPPWRQLVGPWLALSLVGLALVVAGPALGLTIAATGRLSRLGGRLAHRATFPPTVAAVAAGAAVVADLTLLTVIGAQALTGPGPSVWAPVGLAVAASLVRAPLAGRALRRCLAVRAAVA